MIAALQPIFSHFPKNVNGNWAQIFGFAPRFNVDDILCLNLKSNSINKLLRN